MHDYTLSMASGGKPVFLPYSLASSSIFSQDGKYNLVFTSHQIRVYFINTRQCIKTIDIDLLGLVDVKLDLKNPNLVFLYKSDGQILTVNWKDRLSQPIIKVGEIELPHRLLMVIGKRKSHLYVVAGKIEKKLNRNHIHTRYIYKINLKTQEIELVTEIDNVVKFNCSLDCNKLIFITSDHEAKIFDLSLLYQSGNIEDLIIEVLSFPFKSAITSVAISNSSVVAIGTSSGTIQILYGALIDEKPQRLLKWHIDQVNSLQFTPDSNYLLSGGLEKVLVFWQLETDKTQFLPRLNGSIDKIALDNNKQDNYTLLLNDSPGKEHDLDDNHEILILSSVDLISRLSYNSIKPKFANSLNLTISKVKRKSKSDNFDKSKIRHNYSSIFEIHPKTKQLYFPNNSTIQAYDLIKNEQSFVQNAAPTLAAGKVRSETKLIDPTISHIAFTHDGEWLCTFDSIFTSDFDNLLSKNDIQYALKFWKFIESSSSKSETNSINNKTGHWELSTKIIDPHGNSKAIYSIIPAPTSYCNGLAFLTADGKGGLRLWRPRFPKEVGIVNENSKAQQTAWTLRKSKPSGALFSDAIDACWSPDGSIIILGHECSISLYNAQTFEPIPNEIFTIPSIAGSRIRSLSIVDNNLIVLSKTRLSSFNLLTGQLNELVANVNTNVGGNNLITIDPINNLICLAVNYYNLEPEFSLKSKILIFKPDQLKPIYVHIYDQGISSIRYFNSSFIFVDLDYRIGIIESAATSAINSSEEKTLIKDMKSMLISAQATADVINTRYVSATSEKHNDINEIDSNLTTHKVIDLNRIQPVFENIEGIQLETLFDRIMKVVK